MVIAATGLRQGAADSTGWWEMGRRFREGGTEFELQSLLIALAVVTAIVLLLALVGGCLQPDEKRVFYGPRRLFLQLCRAHDLNLLDIWLLWRLAKAHRLGQPATLFLDAACFAPERIPPALHRRRQRLAQLHERLFA